MNSDEIIALERDLDEEIKLPNNWLPVKIERFNTKLLLANRLMMIRILDRLDQLSASIAQEKPGKPDPKDFKTDDGKFNPGAYNKALAEWKKVNESA